MGIYLHDCNGANEGRLLFRNSHAFLDVMRQKTHERHFIFKPTLCRPVDKADTGKKVKVKKYIKSCLQTEYVLLSRVQE